MTKTIYACEKCNHSCMDCFYADSCGDWNDDPSMGIPKVTVKVDCAFMELCKGRHEIPQATDGAIFETEVDPLNVHGLEETAFQKLEGLEQLHLYVTGLTVALVAVLNVCRREGILVTLWHYNRDTGKYYPQSVAL